MASMAYCNVWSRTESNKWTVTVERRFQIAKANFKNQLMMPAASRSACHLRRVPANGMQEEKEPLKISKSVGTINLGWPRLFKSFPKKAPASVFNPYLHTNNCHSVLGKHCSIAVPSCTSVQNPFWPKCKASRSKVSGAARMGCPVTPEAWRKTLNLLAASLSMLSCSLVIDGWWMLATLKVKGLHVCKFALISCATALAEVKANGRSSHIHLLTMITLRWNFFRHQSCHASSNKLNASEIGPGWLFAAAAPNENSA